MDSVEEVFANYVKILSTLQANGITPVIQLTTYVAKITPKIGAALRRLTWEENKEVDKLNKMLSDYAVNNKIEVINLLPSIATRDGYLRPELSWDGVHFKAEAYRIWAREVERILRKFKM
jgi:lysophospholipase L1-like esterase